ncbi:MULTISPECIES: YbhB/YbcL family Raf kinase inhibitor-like protein [unclassified Marinobacter]|uniref:YbhB/YbcL family Raf kinase inhibitor-like protein n=1 Tax=unclassified Marinobacter TaxID=83889 RepID=UPI00273AF5F2|nr:MULTISPECIES: YbhB/YbcL family Raf kinase inhibitor-like protein [unclassified Marinobacter]MDP4547960.1 YbhB/YbcL family Raf kinase inhibitor-like protein [Marinobacter sp. MDS2]
MKLEVGGVEEGRPVPEKFAFGVFNPDNHMSFGPNRNPEMSWEDVPEGTRSFVVMMFDPDVPSVADDVNQEGKTIPADLPRVDFFHWLLVDVPATTRRIPEGEDSDGVSPKGKPFGPGPVGVRGINNYTQFLAGNPDMAGTYAGYDGPCPPWNDEILHHYHFEVHALDVESLNLSGEFDGTAVREAMAGHVLASARVTGTYTLNPELR